MIKSGIMFDNSRGQVVTAGGMPLMQSTGLKDKHGVDIYEDDLWRLGDDTYLIVWCQGDYQSGWKKRAGDNLTDIGLETAVKGEVIGNIHEGVKCT
jgi:hypothetical protein